MKETLYAIKASWIVAAHPYEGYAVITDKIGFVSIKANATLFKSKVLALGWLLKTKSKFRAYKLTIISL